MLGVTCWRLWSEVFYFSLKLRSPPVSSGAGARGPAELGFTTRCGRGRVDVVEYIAIQCQCAGTFLGAAAGRRAHNAPQLPAVDLRPRNCAHTHSAGTIFTLSHSVVIPLLWSVMRIFVVAAVCCFVAVKAKAVGGGKDGLQVEKLWNFLGKIVLSPAHHQGGGDAGGGLQGDPAGEEGGQGDRPLRRLPSRWWDQLFLCISKHLSAMTQLRLPHTLASWICIAVTWLDLQLQWCYGAGDQPD